MIAIANFELALGQGKMSTAFYYRETVQQVWHRLLKIHSLKIMLAGLCSLQAMRRFREPWDNRSQGRNRTIRPKATLLGQLQR